MKLERFFSLINPSIKSVSAPIPAVLVEIGVIANPDEEQRLSKPDTIQRIAKAIATGIHRCQIPKI